MKRPRRFSSTSTVRNSPSGPVRRRASLLIALGAFLLAAVAVPAQAQNALPPPPEPHQLASNLGQTSASTGNALKDYAYAQAFTTGSQQFLLSSVRVDFDAAETGTRQVNAYLYSATSSGRPGNSLAMLTLGVAPTAGVNKFEPTGEYRHSRMAQRILAPNTTYFVVVEAWSTTSTASVALTDSNSEDTGGVSGSSIADGGYRQATGSSTWTASGSAMKIEVNGERYLWVSDEVAREGVTNSTLNFKVRVSPPLASGSSLNVRYVTQGITAKAGSDFEDKDGSLSFSGGDARKDVDVKVLDDRVEDDGETMELVISSMVYTTGTGSETKEYALPKIKNGIGTIRNSEEDPPADASVLSVADAEATEGDAMHFVVTLDPAETVRVTVDYHTTNIGFEYTASSSDYTYTNGTLIFEPGEITKTVSVPIIADEVEDDGETFLLYLWNPVNAQDGGGGVGTIRDRDAQASVTDSQEEEEEESSQQEEVTTTPNTSATGAPTISGTVQVGATLTASTSNIADADGMDNATFTYQWIANDGNADADIQDATAATYTMVDDDEGKTIKVKVTFTDDRGNEETLTSIATVTVAAKPNSAATGAPTITGTGTVQVGATLTADTSGIADADGLTNVSYSYQWVAGDTDIDGATGSSYTLTSSDLGKTITVRVTFTDDAGNAESLTSVATVAVAAKPNSEPTGLPTISGTAQVGATLTADTSGIADADGMDNATFTYQWIANDGTMDTDIADATDSTYTLVAADKGKTIKVRVTFTDDGGTQETLVSAATDPVTVPLTAAFEAMPSEHDRSSIFTFQLRFSENPALSYKVLRDESFDVTGGTVKKARRVNGRHDLREIHIEPTGDGDVTVRLAGGRACGTTGAICTADGRVLSNSMAMRVLSQLTGTEDDATLSGTNSADVLYGSHGADTLSGGGGHDELYGDGDPDSPGSGNDTLDGGTGDDILEGAAGDDTLMGGAGADTFVFAPGHGTDTISDFSPEEEDLIDLTAFSTLTGFAALTLTADGADTVLDLSAHQGGTVRLEGIAPADLEAEDFELP